MNEVKRNAIAWSLAKSIQRNQNEGHRIWHLFYDSELSEPYFKRVDRIRSRLIRLGYGIEHGTRYSNDIDTFHTCEYTNVRPNRLWKGERR